MTHYHTYERVSENKDGRIEICTICKKRLVIKKDSKGRMDNALYAKEHIADIAQPYGATAHIFKKLYGKPKV